MTIQEELVSTAAQLAKKINADSILVLTETGKAYELVKEKFEDLNVIALTPNEETYKKLSGNPQTKVIDFSVRDPTRTGQIRHAVWRGLGSGYLTPGDLVVCMAGEMGTKEGIDTISVYLISEAESTLAGLIESDPVMNATVEISTELGWEGREGKPLGATFVIGDTEKVMNLSHQLGLNPFKGYEDINITDQKNWELVKRYAFLDGAFILDRSGNIIAAGRYLDADAKTDIPAGLGTRHISAASITAATHAECVTVSGTDGVIRIFSNGKIMGKIDPRSKMLEEVSI
ncbi:hypothetical protein AKJ37_06430 [candidate division MSBL1 archaeon SCGC-AAA259I09]|uniref:Diadenylate cyclase n=1 Tax=candidate division MSBL1 archaeon SCGC-AAA259I09 TaxID=1698267 RepID=A0A133UP30_9EURY|nr:hypothetical protein AKJ37_06430 [candidate division MSBL1 archaeon SCGC-AAA259I09]